MFERNVFWHGIGSRLRSAGGFALAAVAISALYIGVYPSFQDQMAGYAEAIPEGMSAFMGSDFASPAGYIQATIFNILGPLLTVGAALTWAAGTIAGEEEAHTLPLLTASPISRLQLAGQKLASVVALLTGLSLVLLAAVLTMATATNMGLSAGNVVAAVWHLHGLGFLAMGIALGVGAATGRRTLAIGIGAGVVIAGFALSGMSQLVEVLAGVRWLSPFYWFNGSEPIRNGVAWGPLALLYGVGTLAAGLGLWHFDRRDLH